MDLLGFGLSDRPAEFGYRLDDHADALARAMDSDGVSDAEVIGHSMGGAVTIALAVRRPDLVSRLVLAEATLDPVPHPRRAASVSPVSPRPSSPPAGWTGSWIRWGRRGPRPCASPIPRRCTAARSVCAPVRPDHQGAADEPADSADIPWSGRCRSRWPGDRSWRPPGCGS